MFRIFVYVVREETNDGDTEDGDTNHDARRGCVSQTTIVCENFEMH